MKIFVAVMLFVIGAMMGSFACCQVWRIKKHDKSKRSHCMKCKYQLRWYDNIPIVSWLALSGKCRKCKKPIGCTEILAELLLGAMFVASFLLWPRYDVLMAGNPWEVARFATFLMLLVALTISFIFDLKWSELPMASLITGGVLGAVMLGINVAETVVADIFGWSMVVSIFGWVGFPIA